MGNANEIKPLRAVVNGIEYKQIIYASIGNAGTLLVSNPNGYVYHLNVSGGREVMGCFDNVSVSKESITVNVPAPKPETGREGVEKLIEDNIAMLARTNPVVKNMRGFVFRNCEGGRVEIRLHNYTPVCAN